MFDFGDFLRGGITHLLHWLSATFCMQQGRPSLCRLQISSTASVHRADMAILALRPNCLMHLSKLLDAPPGLRDAISAQRCHANSDLTLP
mgnify:FL=1